MKIDRICVLAYRGDLELARICIASIRHYCPSIPITLFKDLTKGDFSTIEIEKRFQVATRNASIRGGHGYSKLELLLDAPGQRYLIADSDTIFTGDLVSHLELKEEDFIVSPEPYASPDLPKFKQLYYDIDRVQKWDPQFSFSGYGFNTGHFVATTGIISDQDLNSILRWGSPPKPVNEGMFSLADQGLLNYLLPKLASEGRLTLGLEPFALWGFNKNLPFTPDDLVERRSPPRIIHWAGKKPLELSQITNYELLKAMEDLYYREASNGLIRKFRALRNSLHHRKSRSILKLKMLTPPGLKIRLRSIAQKLGS